jgi:hypothetical protein
MRFHTVSVTASRYSCIYHLKWERQIQPLKYTESRQAYIESMELISIKATGYFFDLLLAQVNFQIAETNLNQHRKYSQDIEGKI